jgi:hypothetical protein
LSDLTSIGLMLLSSDPKNPALIQPAIREALHKWGQGQPHPTGDFLRAVLENNLALLCRR